LCDADRLRGGVCEKGLAPRAVFISENGVLVIPGTSETRNKSTHKHTQCRALTFSEPPGNSRGISLCLRRPFVSAEIYSPSLTFRVSSEMSPVGSGRFPAMTLVELRKRTRVFKCANSQQKRYFFLRLRACFF